jgi:hypothetical protein
MNHLDPFTIDSNGLQREALQAYIAAAITYQEVRSVRVVSVYVLLLTGFFLWFASAWPDLLPDGAARLAWYSWLAVSIGVLLAAGMEWVTHRNLLRSLSRLGRPRKDAVKPADFLEGTD